MVVTPSCSSRPALFLGLVLGFVLLAPRFQAAPTDANPRGVATFECIGLYWRTDEAGACRVRFRRADTDRWHDALPLVYDPRDREYRGSLVGLASDSAYDIELKSSGASTRLAVRTRSDQFPVGKTTFVPTGESSAPVVITTSGTPDAYHLVTAPPGARSTIDLRNTAPAGVVVNASYVIVRGLEIRNASHHGISIGTGRHDIVVEQCHVIHWGRGGGPSSYGTNGGNTDSAVAAATGTYNLTLQRNLLEHPRGAANDWETGHPSGPQAISIFHSDGGNVIRYNDIWSTEDHGFNDGIGGGANFSDRGNMNRDADIYGNIVRHTWDDAIECEGANMNVRIWGNYLDAYHVAIATAATFKGPLYIFRNVAGASRRSHRNVVGHVFLKTGDRDHGGGRRYVFHNTLLQPNGPLNIFGAATPNCVTRNNVFDAPNRLVPPTAPNASGVAALPSDFDYDLFTGSDKGDAIERHGVITSRIHHLFLPSLRLEFYPASSVTQIRGGKIPVKFGAEERIVTDPVLQVPSPLIDRGQPLPNFNDGYTGQAPDLGAFEVGRPPLEFGRRAYLRYDEGWAPWERF